MIRKQLELIHLVSPCVRNYAHVALAPTRPDTGQRCYTKLASSLVHSSDKPSGSKNTNTDGGLSVTHFHRGGSRNTKPFRQTSQVTDSDEQPRLPRYLRREIAHSSPATSSQTEVAVERKADRVSPPTTISLKESAYRSRHFKPPQDNATKPEIRLLEPHVLSARLKKLCDANRIDAAVSMLKNAPLDAQNTPVWNTLIWECMKVKRFKLAYQLFIDMKRRGFSPTTRTFQTMFTGLSRIEHWSSHPKQLVNAHSIYDSYQRHMTSVKKDDPNSPELSVNPLASYIKLLGDAGQYQEVFDVYYAMDSEGPLAPNQFIFTAIFQALSAKSNSSGTRDPAVYFKKAADAKLLWNQMRKACLKPPGFQVDSFIVTSAIIALSRGRPADQNFALQIVRDYFGLTVAGDPPSTGTIPLTPQSFAAVLALCNNSRKFSLCDDFLQQVKRRPEHSGGVSILDRAHLEEILRARLSLPAAGSAAYTLGILEWMLRQEITGKNGPKIRPALTTFNLVLTACWRDGDWTSATRAFDLMTGYHAHDFMDGSILNPPRYDKRAPGRNLFPTAETMASLTRSALATHDHANVRQCLRIVDHLGIDPILTRTSVTEGSKAAKNRAFYGSKFSSALIDSVSFVLNRVNSKGHFSQEEARQWRSLANRAEQALKKSNFIPTIEEK